MDLASLHKLLLFGIEKGVSDIHFEVGYPPHYRISGELLGVTKVPALRPDDTRAVARLILEARAATLDLDRSFRELDVTYDLPGSGRFRASIFRQRGQIGVVLRHIPYRVKSFAELNLPPILGEISESRRGLVLVTGATGNGKTTTIASMVRHLNETRRAHIVTIEDPVEFVFEPGKCLIIQRELQTDTPSFRDALTAVLRQDPDVIVVGEVRDVQTAEICLEAAETGHLVISALHTHDTTSTIQRFVGLFAPTDQDQVRERLGDALQAVVSIRLLVARSGRGRVPAVEVLRMTRTVRECVRTAGRLGDIAELMRRGRDLYGMQLFDQQLLELVNSDQITLEAAMYACSNPEEFERSMTIE